MELVTGTALVAVAGLAGLFFVRTPAPNPIDTLGNQLLPAGYGARWAHDLTLVGSFSGVLIGIVVLFVVGLTRDWVRAVACAVAPLGAVFIVDQVAKPLVHRHIGDAVGSYPSGTVTAVAALAAGAVLVAPRIARAVAAVLAAALVVGISAAVVVLRWHYPTTPSVGPAWVWAPSCSSTPWPTCPGSSAPGWAGPTRPTSASTHRLVGPRP